MKITESLKRKVNFVVIEKGTVNQQICCPLRKAWVAATPEEWVRQRLLQQMLGPLAYPRGLLAVEVSLREMPHLRLARGRLPRRRADILCYSTKSSGVPLLLIECKATPLDSKVIRQATSYNFHVGAQYVAVVNQEQQQLGWYDLMKQEYRFHTGFPAYEVLLSRVTAD